MNFLDAPAPNGPPNMISMLGESRAMLDIGSMAFSFVHAAFSEFKAKETLPIILFPGFASRETYMSPLGLYLDSLGYQTEGWGLGTNLAGTNLKHTLEDISSAWDVEPKDDYDPVTYKGEGGIPYLCDLVTERVRQRSKELGSPVILIGWSLGGYLARETARDLPDEVAQVITLGAPVMGGPKYTSAASAFRAIGYDLDWMEREASKRESRLIEQPITAIISRTDAIVNWLAAIDRHSPNVEHVEVNTSHLGMGFNRQIWKSIVKALEQYA